MSHLLAYESTEPMLFLELLRYRLPDLPEHMLAFIYLAYSMMALLKESVPAFEDTWIDGLLLTI
jgi:hypothetical protein